MNIKELEEALELPKPPKTIKMKFCDMPVGTTFLDGSNNIWQKINNNQNYNCIGIEGAFKEITGHHGGFNSWVVVKLGNGTTIEVAK